MMNIISEGMVHYYTFNASIDRELHSARRDMCNSTCTNDLSHLLVYEAIA